MRTFRAPAACLALFLAVSAPPASSVPAIGAPDPGPARARSVPGDIALVRPTAETDPVPESGDAADDPAIWVSHTDPRRSLIIGNDKRGALQVYGLDGTERQRITTGTSFWGNVDVRQGVDVGGGAVDVVAAMNGGLRFYLVDAATRTLVGANEGGRPVRTGGGEGLCLYHRGADALFAFVIARSGRVAQYRVTDADADGRLTANRVRQFAVGSEAEGCVVDDANGALYLAQEDVALWRLDADPGATAAKTRVDGVGRDGHLVSDIEGVTLAADGTGGAVIVSAQNVAHPRQSYFAAYKRVGNAYLGAFRIVDGNLADGCSRTDGVAAYAGSLGPRFPQGVFVCQDDDNQRPAPGNQNFKLTRLERVITLR